MTADQSSSRARLTATNSQAPSSTNPRASELKVARAPSNTGADAASNSDTALMSPTPLPCTVKGTESAIPACAIGPNPNWVPSRTETPNSP